MESTGDLLRFSRVISHVSFAKTAVRRRSLRQLTHHHVKFKSTACPSNAWRFAGNLKFATCPSPNRVGNHGLPRSLCQTLLGSLILRSPNHGQSLRISLVTGLAATRLPFIGWVAAPEPSVSPPT